MGDIFNQFWHDEINYQINNFLFQISQQCLSRGFQESNDTDSDDNKLYNLTVDELEYHIPQVSSSLYRSNLNLLQIKNKETWKTCNGISKFLNFSR